EGTTTPKSLRRRLKLLATGDNAYEHTYKDSMDRIERQSQDQIQLAKGALCWVTFAYTQLSTFELQHALAVEPDLDYLDKDNIASVEDIVAATGGLIALDETSRIIRLVHFTLQEYLKNNRESLFKNRHNYMYKTCAIHLAFECFSEQVCNSTEQFKEQLTLYPLY
ncbi:ankyrin repeat protein, partial [Polyplosphaeria fusca]